MTADDEKKRQALQAFSQWFSDAPLVRSHGGSRRRIVVGSIKLLLSGLAIGLVVMLLAWPYFFQQDQSFNLGFTDIETREVEVPVMVNPRFSGVDESGQPYTFTAKAAIQESESEVQIEDVSGDITLKDGRWLTLTAKEGFLNTQNNKVRLVNQVNIISDEGVEFVTDEANIDLNAGLANGNKPVTGQSRPGTLNASGFSILDNGDTIVFAGPVKVIIYPKAGL